MLALKHGRSVARLRGADLPGGTIRALASAVRGPGNGGPRRPLPAPDRQFGARPVLELDNWGGLGLTKQSAAIGSRSSKSSTR